MICEWSRTGEYHRETSGENQDCTCSMQHDGNTVITLADGVSTCPMAKEGARTAADALARLMAEKGSLLTGLESERIAGIAAAQVLFELKRKAGREGRAVEDYSSTIAGVLFSRENGKLLCYSLGDSIIIAVSGGRCRILAKPCDSSDGCCVTTTKESEKEAVVRVIDSKGIDSVVICSDGAWRMMFDKNRIRNEVKDILTAGDYELLGDHLSACGGYDDSSFIAMDIKDGRAA